jgi:hypothetical protein
LSKVVNVYVKKALRLDLLSPKQLDMYRVGQVGLRSILDRVSKAHGADDKQAPPLKSKKWTRIKKAAGLRPIRDLWGTGMMMSQGIWEYRNKRKGKVFKGKDALKHVGHMQQQIAVRRVSDNRVDIVEPSTTAGRIKARGNRDMLLLSPNDKAALFEELKKRFGTKHLIKFSTPGDKFKK